MLPRLAALLTLVAVGLLLQRPLHGQQVSTGRQAGRSGTKGAVDLLGDPLPPGALARLGSVRLRAGAPVARLAFSSDGKQVATARDDGKVILWDSRTGKEVHVFVHPANDISALAFSPDGKVLATAATQDRRQRIRLWDIASGREIEHFDKKDSAALTGLVFSPDGRVLAGVFAEGMVILWRVERSADVRGFR